MRRVNSLAAAVVLLTARTSRSLEPRPACATLRRAGAQFDRKQLPPVGKPPELRVPVWTTSKLSNGAQLIVSQRKDLPLVSFTITFIGGSNQFEKADRRGTAAFTTAMLREGTKTRSGEQLALDLQLLGTSVNAGVGGESGSISFQSTTEKFQPTLEILVDMMLNSTFPAAALERLRAQRLVALAQANAQPGTIGNRVFSRVLYGAGHPYGQDANEATIKAVTREDVASFHKEYFQPGRAIITVVGDVDAASVKGAIEKALSAWSAGGEKPSFTYPATPPLRPAAIYLVDKPGAAQSVVNIGIARAATQYPRLHGAAGDEFHPRRPLPVAAEREYPRGEGLQLRRELRILRTARAPGRFGPGGTWSATRPMSR